MVFSALGGLLAGVGHVGGRRRLPHARDHRGLRGGGGGEEAKGSANLSIFTNKLILKMNKLN